MNKTDNQIIKNAPKLTQKMLKEANRYFKGYLFYETTKEGRNFKCSCCNKEFSIKYSNRLGQAKEEAMRNGHNNFGRCPQCGEEVMYKNIGKSKKCKNLWQIVNVAYVMPKQNKDEVYIMCFELSKDYEYSKTPAVESYLHDMYYITPDKGIMFEHGYWTDRLYSNKRIKEPFLWTGFFYGNGYQPYFINGAEKLENTFLKYIYEECKNNNNWLEDYFCRFLTLYPTHKAMEMLLKINMKQWVRELVVGEAENKRLISWSGQTATEIFKCDKQQFKEMRRLEITPSDMKTHKKLNKVQNHTIVETKNLIDLIGDYYVRDLIDKAIIHSLKPKKIIKYLNKSLIKEKEKNCKRQYRLIPTLNSEYTEWKDYLRMAEQLNYDLTQEIVLMPKYLHKAHDIAYKTIDAIRREEQRKRDEEHRKRREKELAHQEKSNNKLYSKRVKQYAYENNQFAIVVPEKLRDIVREGQLMHHCVGGYAARHAEGKTTILFLRNKAELDKPLYTIEIKGTDVVQIQGYGNRTPLTPKAEKFFQSWKAKLKADEQNKNKKATTKAVA